MHVPHMYVLTVTVESKISTPAKGKGCPSMLYGENQNFCSKIVILGVGYGTHLLRDKPQLI